MRRLRLLAALAFLAATFAVLQPAVAAARAAPGDVARALRRQQLFLTTAQTKTVQRRIHVRADGDWGSNTVTAMRRFQRRRHLAVTGSANVESLRAMHLRVADRFEARLWADRAAANRRRTPAASSATAAAALRWARTRLGTPYLFGGRTIGGFDCSGLVLWSYRHAGLRLPRTSFAMYRRGWAVTKGAIRPGDLVFFDAAGPGASHVGLVVSRTTAISATSSSGVAIHDIARGYWAQHYVGARRLAAT
jgi:peptidoglycan DL-endopeptidase CwlO